MKSGIAATIASPSRYDHALGARRRSPDWIIWPALAVALATGIVLAPGPARPQTGVALVKVDLSVVMQGYRLSKVIGSSVVNDANETIGTIDDLLVSHDGKQPYAVLSIGGFLGMGTRLVVVPYDLLKFADKRVTLPGGTKEGLKMLPEFKYATG